MGELKQMKISSLKSLIIAFLLLTYKEVLSSFSQLTYEIFNHSKHTKIEEDRGLQLERGLELFFQKN